MALFMVSYDLHKQGQNYTCLTDKLNDYVTHWHLQGSVWLIESESPAAVIAKALAECLDANDKLVVVKLSRDAALSGYGDDAVAWLDAHL